MMGGALLREKTTVEQMVGVFGALGVFYLVNRQALGRYGAGAIINWLFWLGLNLVFGFIDV